MKTRTASSANRSSSAGVKYSPASQNITRLTGMDVISQVKWLAARGRVGHGQQFAVGEFAEARRQQRVDPLGAALEVGAAELGKPVRRPGDDRRQRRDAAGPTSTD